MAIALSLALADMAFITAILSVTPPIVSGHSGISLIASAVAAAALQCIGFFLGLYDAQTSNRLRRGIQSVFWLALLATGSAVIVGFAALDPTMLPGIAVGGVSVMLTMVLLRLAVAGWIDRNASGLAERILLVATPQAASRLLRGGRSAHDPQHIVGMIAIGDPCTAPVKVLAAIDSTCGDAASTTQAFLRMGEALRDHARTIDRAVIIPADLDDERLSSTIDRLDHLPFEIALAPSAYAQETTDNPLDSRNCRVVRPRAMTHRGRMAKRVFDVFSASILLLILSPLLLLVAFLIRLGSPGPALFRQPRWGWNSETFTVYKFRTMWSGAAAADGSLQATRGDKRVTRIGALLRRSSLDELPQLLNVLNGTMSLVGPRPHPVELNLRYLGVVDRYAARHRVVPGMTGLAQIKGFRGETGVPSLMQKRVELDLEYIRTRSFFLDVMILLKTAGSVVRGVNAH